MCWIHRGLQGIALKRSAQCKIPKRRYRDQRRRRLQTHINLHLTQRRKHQKDPKETKPQKVDCSLTLSQETEYQDKNRQTTVSSKLR